MYTNNSRLVGTIRNTRFPYWDRNKQKLGYKGRPVLILSVENEMGKTDLTTIPVSKISDKRRIIKDSDIKIERAQYPLLKWREDISYLRTSKITTINLGEVDRWEISDLKTHYPKLFENVLSEVKQFVNNL